MRANIKFCDIPPGVPDTAIVLRDVGHDKGCPSVISDADAVVVCILRIAAQLNEPKDVRIFYYDSEGTLDELCHDGAQFTGFKPGPR